jgi:hypothetical protein
VAEADPQHPAGGDDLVVVVGLQLEGGEAKDRAEGGQPGDEPESAGAISHC